MGEIKKPTNQELVFGTKSFHLLPPRPDLQDLIASEKEVRGMQISLSPDAIGSFQSPHLSFWLGDFAGDKQARHEILATLKDQDIVDLGAGATPEVFRELFRIFHPSSYIGVDLFVGADHTSKVIEGFGDVVNETYEAEEGFSSAIIRGDMLEVASRLPSAEFSVCINGLDDYVLPDRPHRTAVQREIKRITKVGGMVFGYTGNAGMQDGSCHRQRPRFLLFD
jgi:hypothetical protein